MIYFLSFILDIFIDVFPVSNDVFVSSSLSHGEFIDLKCLKSVMETISIIFSSAFMRMANR